MHKTPKRISTQGVLRTFHSMTYLKYLNSNLLPGTLKENSEAKVKEKPCKRKPVKLPARHGHCSLTATRLELWLPGTRRTMALASHAWPDDKNEDGLQRTGMGEKTQGKQVSKLHQKTRVNS